VCACARLCLLQDCALDIRPLKGSTQNFALAYKRNNPEFASRMLRIEIALAQALRSGMVLVDDASDVQAKVQRNCSVSRKRIPLTEKDSFLDCQRWAGNALEARPTEFGATAGWGERGMKGWVVVVVHAGVLVAAFLLCLILLLLGMVCFCTLRLVRASPSLLSAWQASSSPYHSPHNLSFRVIKKTLSPLVPRSTRWKRLRRPFPARSSRRRWLVGYWCGRYSWPFEDAERGVAVL
jgi:hypothetical protein